MAKIKSFEVLISATLKFYAHNSAGQKFNHLLGWDDAEIKTKWGTFTITPGCIIFNVFPMKTFKSFTTAVESGLEAFKSKASTPITLIFDGFGTTSIEPIYDARDKVKTYQLPYSSSINIVWKKDGDNNWPEDIDPLDATHIEATSLLAQTLDAYLGLPSVVWDDQAAVNQMTSRFGTFTPKTLGDGWHGMSYYGLTNQWANRTSTCDLVFENSINAFKGLMSNPDLPEELYDGHTTTELLSQVKEYESDIYGIVHTHSQIHDPYYYRVNREKAA